MPVDGENTFIRHLLFAEFQSIQRILSYKSTAQLKHVKTGCRAKSIKWQRVMIANDLEFGFDFIGFY